MITKKTSPKPITVAVTSEYATQRVDNFLLREFKNVPKSHIYKLVRKGAIRVNGKKVKAEYKLQEDDQLSFPKIEQSAAIAPTKVKAGTIQLLEKAIVYENDDLLILNKPSKMAVHAGSGIKLGVIETMRQARPKLKGLELVHRLDRDTSGLLILAKKRSALRELHELIREGKVFKSYLLLAQGPWVGGTRKVEASLLKNSVSSGERMVKVTDDGKNSITIFHPKQHCTKLDAVLLEAELKTGRTHQIRVHAAHIGHPIAGDEKYGSKDFNLAMRKAGLRRLFLHAAHLKFKRQNGDVVDVSAELPDELLNILH